MLEGGAADDRKGLLLALSSPSGAGKSSLAKRLLKWDSSIVFSVSATTRRQREGEVHGRDYLFYDHATFEEIVKKDRMLEYARVYGNYYGSPADPVEEALRQGQDVLFDVDWQGVQQIRGSHLGLNVVSIFILPPSIRELEQRLVKRGQDSPEVIAGRMEQARSEINHWPEYDYVLINRNLGLAAEQITSIVMAERLKRQRQSGLTGFVQKLNSEFERMAR